MDDFSGSQGNELLEAKRVLWGTSIKDDVFQSWSQGFYFSKDEPTALIQDSGGPCAVIAPVQAFIVKAIIKEPHGDNWREVDSEAQDELLVGAICQILVQAAQHNGGSFVLVDRNESSPSTPSRSEEPLLLQIPGDDHIEPTVDVNSHIHFHQHLRILHFENREEVETFYLQRVYTLHGKYGILLFLYSVMMTKGIEQILSEVSDPAESLIDDTHGYGSQSLINLMLTGRAVSNVWDHEQNVGGMRLLGIDSQSEIGFLAYLEHMKYLEVGSFLKNPKNPVWVLESETHLTVLFSFEEGLISLETPSEVARREFRKYDPEGNNFILATNLGELLKTLGCQHDPPYLKSVMKSLDPEDLGIILLTTFLQEFYPEDKKSIPDTFILYHYNGLQASNTNGLIQYQEGQAVLLECDMKTTLESNPILKCLQTKWHNIQLNWPNGPTPSLD